MSPSEVAASYRLYAAYCFEATRVTSDPGRKLALLNMAQAWTDLANLTQKSGNGNDPSESSSSLRAQLTRSAFMDSAK
jgi:hypothetical protein